MPNTSRQTAKNFRRKFSGAGKNDSQLESTAPSGDGKPFEEKDVEERLGTSREGLNKLIENYFDNDRELLEIAERIFKEGGEPLRAVANEDEIALEKHINKNPAVPSMLEAIVQTDGSRPSFMIRDDKIDFNSSPVGDWDGKLLSDSIKKAIKCVGRINIGLQHIGTGFLIHDNLVMTNRHVLQSIAIENNGVWTINPGAQIDFGFEYRAQGSVFPRSIKKVIYCGPKFIDRMHIDHSKPDMAILELEHVPQDMIPLSILKWDQSTTWAFPGAMILTIGYPGDPGLTGIQNYTATLLDKLFRSTYGCKRLAPGKIMMPMASQDPITIAHDATTLAGNSGSLVMLIDPIEASVCGLHYGGETEQPRENWGHHLGLAWKMISETDETAFDLLKDKIKFIN